MHSKVRLALSEIVPVEQRVQSTLEKIGDDWLDLDFEVEKLEEAVKRLESELPERYRTSEVCISSYAYRLGMNSSRRSRNNREEMSCSRSGDDQDRNEETQGTEEVVKQEHVWEVVDKKALATKVPG